MLGLLPIRLALLWAVDPAEADAFNMVTVQYIDGVAVNYPDYSSGQARFAPVALSAASLSIGCGFCLDKLSAAQMATT
jgi:alkylhydroperoxidase family enzyme